MTLNISREVLKMLSQEFLYGFLCVISFIIFASIPIVFGVISYHTNETRGKTTEELGQLRFEKPYVLIMAEKKMELVYTLWFLSFVGWIFSLTRLVG
jgi:hypothetical protein